MSCYSGLKSMSVLRAQSLPPCQPVLPESSLSPPCCWLLSGSCSCGQGLGRSCPGGWVRSPGQGPWQAGASYTPLSQVWLGPCSPAACWKCRNQAREAAPAVPAGPGDLHELSAESQGRAAVLPAAQPEGRRAPSWLHL